MKARKRLNYSSRLNSHCPVCFGTEGLEISLKQDEVSTVFYNKASTNVEENLYCHSCNNMIYPVNWNEDIEKVVDYHRKLAGPRKSYLQIKPLTYVIILVAIAAVAAAVYSIL